MPEDGIKRVFVLRGLPGTGKSDLADYLINKLATETGSVLLSSDDYFLDNEGNYKFDQTKVQLAHQWNFKRFKQAIERGISPIIIDNSNIKRFHYYQYVDYGQRHDYRVNIVILPHNDSSDRELEARTPHGITKDTIGRMREAFEWKT